MDRDSMASSNAEQARQKSGDVMAALKRNDGSADGVMGKRDVSSQQSIRPSVPQSHILLLRSRYVTLIVC